MASTTEAIDFVPSLGCLLAPSLDELATQLVSMAGLHPRERELILTQTRESLYGCLHAKLTRLLLLELNGARVTGRLQGADAAQRWIDFLDLSSRPDFWDELEEHYPSLRPRIDHVVRNRCAASRLFAQRWVADRAGVASLCNGFTGELTALDFGAGDSHRGGLTVILLRCQGGRIVYKPRSVAVDIALHDFIAELSAEHGDPLSIRVPRVIARESYGWAEFIEHRYASDDFELGSFYRGIGHWLAIMHLLGANDLHAENLIAHGTNPVIVDCETLFAPKVPVPPSGLGDALDQASELVAGTVLNIGLLPGRAQGLAWRGVDYSGVGSLPGQQPMLPHHTILKAGTDEAHLGTILLEAPVAQNHPSPKPALALFWPEALEAFDKLTSTLQRLDAAGSLQRRLRIFAQCRVRVVLRSTETYAELTRMLWHPVSLHNPEQARRHAHELLAKMAVNVPSAPNDPNVIDAEIEDLLIGDIPFFTTVVSDGRLEGPRGTAWMEPSDLSEASLRHWRSTDFRFERKVIQAAMVSAYLNDGWSSGEDSLLPATIRMDDLDARRRAQAARIMRGLVANAILGEDGSATWIAPVFNPSGGWSVQPLTMDLYAGLSGVALLTGAYLRETHAGRADPVDGIEDLFVAVQKSLRLAELKVVDNKNNQIRIRPPATGGYIGLGSQIWTLLVLASWNCNQGDELARACALAEDIIDASTADDADDLLVGKAGAIIALLALAAKTGQERFLVMGSQLGDQLCERAQYKEGQAFWLHPQMWPHGIGGFAHGVSGIGWALARLARASGNARHEQTARAAFAFEDALFDTEEMNWLDLRELGGPKTSAAWCHGSVGIGLAQLDLDPHLKAPHTRLWLRRAAMATWRLGLGWNHCLCHGDLGSWELLDRAMAHGEGPEGLTREALLAQILTSIENRGPTCGLTREVFVPGLFPGVGGVAYQLLRAHPDSRLPSVLILGEAF